MQFCSQIFLKAIRLTYLQEDVESVLVIVITDKIGGYLNNKHVSASRNKYNRRETANADEYRNCVAQVS